MRRAFGFVGRYSAACMRASRSQPESCGVWSVGVAVPWSVVRTIMLQRDEIRNIAVIAHVDHGKTTLVDGLLKQSGTLQNATGRVMDSKDQEKERGITILAKNTAIRLDGGRQVNIVDTPGHLDFSGEVERALQMVEGFILLVDAQESVKPGTRYVLRKALSLNLKPIVVLNKIDKDDTNISKTESDIQDLFLELATDDSQLDIFFLYGSGRDQYMNEKPAKGGTLKPLFDNIFKRIPAPQSEDTAPFQMLVAQLDQDPKTGHKIAIGRIFKGSVKLEDVVCVRLQDQKVNALVKKIQIYRGTHKDDVPSARFGDIVLLVLLAPIEQTLPLEIGATVCDKDRGEAWPYRPPDEPTFSLAVGPNTAAWKEKETPGRVNANTLRDRIEKELMTNTAMKVEYVEGGRMMLKGRGPLHLSVFLEDMRREGLEMEVSAPSVTIKKIDGIPHEPWEDIQFEVKSEMVPEVTQMAVKRHAELGNIDEVSNGRSVVHCALPVRAMLGLPVEFYSLTKGDGVLQHSFKGYLPLSQSVTERETGTLVSLDEGTVTSYALTQLQTHGRFFVVPGDYVYAGQVVGENTKQRLQDLPVNVTKEAEVQSGFRANAVDAAKKTRASYSATRMGFEDALGWVTPEESIVLTPQTVRVRLPSFNGKTRMRKPKTK